MKKFLTLVLLFTAVVSFAQQAETKNEGMRGPYLTNGFFDNWFVSAGGGVQIYNGEYDNRLTFGGRLSPALDLSLGKWITPSVGVRVQYSGLRVIGAVSSLGRYKEEALVGCPGCYLERFNMFNLHGDFLWNVSNAIGGYRADRLLEFIPFVGVGYARSWKTDISPVKEVGFTGGLINKVRLTPAIDLNLELKVLLVNDRFDGFENGEGIEELTTATIGFTYNFPKRTFDRPEKPIIPDYTPYNSKISDLEKQIAAADARAKRLADDLNAEKNKKPMVIESKTEYIVSPLAVFFQIGKAELTDKEIINLGYCADVIKKSGKTFKILGSADHNTGTKKFNQTLSEKRARRVLDVLVNKFGVDPSKLEVIAKGEENEPFGKAVLNRVVIVEN